ncbi:PQQ-dependent sugar dehydrogenase [Zavarzinella formosa]|uniref:PQQ-dependent sugar dehydrogenase n=1 Tax=Zavarzinella formosa TaxID=360055 RepID=UPI00138AFE71|nr:PQQ-dependent sugar dehydrogenase [Zavarzinella formosa]
MIHRLLAILTLAILSNVPVFMEVSKAEPLGDKRQPWTTSKLLGAPEPPSPYRPQRVFPKLQFDKPVHLELNKTQNRWYVVQQEGKILSFPNALTATGADVAIDVSKDLKSWKPDELTDKLDSVYGLTFHPKFAENGFCYVCYVLRGKKGDLPEGSRVSRFTVTKTVPPKIDPASEEVLITFQGGGHNGGCLVFGPDGCLYISTGDAANPNPPDARNTGQDCSDLLSSILRIDVDHRDAGKKYAIPKDNPFVGREGIRPEIWAFGFRNPWKMSFDRVEGSLWAGDVGWEMWEMIYKVARGGNYGWSIKEGPQSVRPDVKIGPTPILPPAISFPHSEAASITGGFVYRGKKWKDLAGAYVCGDWMSRKFWATTFDGDKIATHREIASSQHQIVGFAEDADGELFYLDYSPQGGIYSFVPNEEAGKPQPPFPKKLSETGLWNDLSGDKLAAGTYAYSINAEPWADHAAMSRVVAIPGEGSATIYHSLQKVPDTAWFNTRVFFPKNAVLAKTFTLEMEAGQPASRRRVETQVMHFNGVEWRGYTYKWNDAQTDASLVAATGEDVELKVKDAASPGRVRRQTWHFSGRSECRQCHNPWAGEVLSFTEPQLRSDVSKAGDNTSWNHLSALGVIKRGDEKLKPGEIDDVKLLVNPYSTEADKTAKARSYLQVNCSHCHQFGAGGSVNIDLRMETELDRMNVLEEKPVQGTFDIPGCQIVAPGDPYRSALYYRIAKQGRGRMPHIGSELADDRGVKLIRDWIRQLPGRKDDRTLVDACAAKEDSPARKEAIVKLLGSPAGALMLAEAWDDHRLPDSAKTQILAAASTKEAPIRDLFERYVPDDQKVKRLGTIIRAESLLAMKGDASRGKDVFFNKAASQCAQCHKIGGQGGEIGPDLSQIGKKMQKRQLLESIVDPSKDIDAKFASYTAEIDDGRLVSGLVIKQTAAEVIVRDNQGKDTVIPVKKLVTLTPSKKSLMPEQLLRDMTAEQAADLLAYLESLK